MGDYMTDVASLQLLTERLRGHRDVLVKNVRDTQELIRKAKADRDISDKARSVIQEATKQIQDKLQYKITTVGTMALSATFPETIILELQFQKSAGKTMAKLLFDRGDGHLLDPIDEDSGGACSIAGMGLRAAMREVQRPKTRPILILDEPLAHLNDPTREMHRKACEMLEEISKGLGVQILAVTMVPELKDVGKEVRINKRRSDNDYCNSKLNDPCSGCRWDSDDVSCNHPMFEEMVEAGIIADCWEEDIDRRVAE